MVSDLQEFLEDIVAFTGTSRGMTPLQKLRLRDILIGLWVQGYRKFRHGDCVGADVQAAQIAKDLGYYIVCHPGHPLNKPNETKYRGFFPDNDVTLPVREFIRRDHDMVNGSNCLVAAPYQDYEVTRSGSWATVRYAREKGKDVSFAYPDRKYKVPAK